MGVAAACLVFAVGLAAYLARHESPGPGDSSISGAEKGLRAAGSPDSVPDDAAGRRDTPADGGQTQADADTDSVRNAIERLDCEPAEVPAAGSDAFSASQQDRQGRLVRMRERLVRSPDPDHRLVAALIAGETEDPRTVFASLLRDAPGHPLVLWNAHQYCRSDPGAMFCNDQLMDRTLAVEGENGALWLRIAAHRHVDGELEGALAAINRAATAPDFDIYWYEHVRLFARGIDAAGVAVAGNRWIDAIGFAAALPEDLYRIAPACRDRSEDSVSWRYACLRVGERMEAESRTLLGEAIGLGLQITALEAEGDNRALANARKRERRLRDDVNFAGSDLGPEFQAILVAKPGLVGDAIAVGAADGERAAQAFLRDEVIRRATLPGYATCD